MTDFIRGEELLPGHEIDNIVAHAPANLLRFQDAAVLIPIEERPHMTEWLARFNAGLMQDARGRRPLADQDSVSGACVASSAPP